MRHYTIRNFSRLCPKIHGFARSIRIELVAPRFYAWTTQLRWLCRGLLSQRRTALPDNASLIVSLTSFPERFRTLPLTLKCLLTQTRRPNHVILWLAEDDRKQLTPGILALCRAGLEIRYCDDLRSYKKIIPAIEAFPDACIVTADDDLYYWPSWLEELAGAYGGDRRTALCHRAHCIRFDSDGRLAPYQTWPQEIRTTERSPLVFPTTGGGVLYPPGILAQEATNRERFLDLCPSGDDIWLYWMLRHNGGCARRVARFRDIIAWSGSQSITLWQHNITVNDAQIGAMTKHYGIPQSEC